MHVFAQERERERERESARAPLSYLQWLCTRQLEWHKMQAVLVEEFQKAAMNAAMQMMMLLQVLNVVRGSYLPEGARREADYQPQLPVEATMRAHRLVGEIIERRSSSGGGEAQERRKGARRAMQRMESSSHIRQVRARSSAEGEGHGVDRDGPSGTRSREERPSPGRTADHHSHDEDTDMTSMMHTDRPWRKKTRTDATSSTHVLKLRPLTPAVNTSHEVAEEEDDSIGGGETHDGGYHRLRQDMGVAEPGEEPPRCSGFSTSRLQAVRQYFSAGGDANYIVRVLEDIGYTCKAGHAGEERTTPERSQKIPARCKEQ